MPQTKTMAPRRLSRRGEILRLMRKLEWNGFPRLQMLFLVLLTGAAGLGCSYVLLRAGVDSMLARYPLSVGCAYVVFLLLLWLWLRTKAEDYLDAPSDLPLPGSGRGGSTAPEPDFSGGGGQYGGGGASGRFEFSESLPAPSSPGFDLPGGDSAGGAVGDAIGAADEGAVPLAIVVLLAVIAAALLFSVLYIVYLAPALFAELLVDGVLSASLYRRLRGLQTRHWLESAVRRTVLPFAITAVTLGLVGYALQSYAPQAQSLGAVLQHYRALNPH